MFFYTVIFFHILFNSLAQILFCLGVEKSWGTLKFIFIYFLGGIFGGFVGGFRSLGNKNSVSVGASAAIFAVLFAYVALWIIYYSRLSEIHRRSFIFFVFMIIVMFVVVCFVPNVDILGHVGGIISGFGIGMIIFSREADSPKKKLIFLIIGLILTFSLLISCFCTYIFVK